MQLYYPRHGMPHGYVCARPMHIIYRLQGCLPVGPLRAITRELSEQLSILERLGPSTNAQIESLKEEYFLRYDELLDAQDQTRYLLLETAVRRIVLDSWMHLARLGRCRIIAVCVMGNHVHVLVVGFEGAKPYQVGDLVGQHKRFTDNATRKLLGRLEPVWAAGFFDRYVRPGQLQQVTDYILDNPVKAGLVRDSRAWAGTFVDEELLRVLRDVV